MDTLNVPMVIRQKRLGHADINKTMKYTHSVTEEERRVSEVTMFDDVVRLIGFVGSDAELKTTKTQREYTVLSLATTESWKDKNGDGYIRRTEWHRLETEAPSNAYNANIYWLSMIESEALEIPVERLLSQRTSSALADNKDRIGSFLNSLLSDGGNSPESVFKTEFGLRAPVVPQKYPTQK